MASSKTTTIKKKDTGDKKAPAAKTTIKKTGTSPIITPTTPTNRTGGTVSKDGKKLKGEATNIPPEKESKSKKTEGTTPQSTGLSWESLGTGYTPTPAVTGKTEPDTRGQSVEPARGTDWAAEYKNRLGQISGTTASRTESNYDAELKASMAARSEAAARREEERRAASEQRAAERKAEREQSENDLWESLEYTYGKKREKSDREYDQLASKTDRQMLSRGMQRSSYGAQTQANIGKQKIDAQGDIYDAQIADYQDRITQLRDKEREQENWERQFEESQRQFDTSMDYQRERAEVQDTQFNRNLAEQQFQFDTNLSYQKERAAAQDLQFEMQLGHQQERDLVSDTQWQKTFEENARQFNENLASNERIAAGHDATSIATANISAAASRYSADQSLAASKYSADTSRSIAEMQNETSRWATEQQLGFSREQLAASQSQTAQSTAFSQATTLLQSGIMPTKEMLQAAGIDKSQAEKLLKKPATTGAGSQQPKTPQHTPLYAGQTDQGWQDYIGQLFK